jgi:predicted RNA-binding Zn-ribbon protein involved in translation (DUF1610 family)
MSSELGYWRAQCPGCGKTLVLRLDGRFREHGPRNKRCPGCSTRAVKADAATAKS